MEQAVKIFNQTSQTSLLGFDPITAHTDPDAIAQLQAYYFRKRREHADRFKNEKPAFQVGQRVKIVETPSAFGQRVTQKRYSKENYIVDKVIQSAPLSYRLQSVNRLFYKEQLTPTQSDEVLQKSLKEKRLLSILSHKRFATKFLRSGKPIEFEKRYLVRIKGKEEATYLTEDQIHAYDNGQELLTAYNSKLEHVVEKPQPD